MKTNIEGRETVLISSEIALHTAAFYIVLAHHDQRMCKLESQWYLIGLKNNI